MYVAHSDVFLHLLAQQAKKQNLGNVADEHVTLLLFSIFICVRVWCSVVVGALIAS